MREVIMAVGKLEVMLMSIMITDVDNDEDDAFDVHAHEDTGGVEVDHIPSVVCDPPVFSSDEAYARALQDAEDRDVAARLMAFAGIDDREAEDAEDQGGNSRYGASLAALELNSDIANFLVDLGYYSMQNE